jgi:hypothetical protein
MSIGLRSGLQLYLINLEEVEMDYFRNSFLMLCCVMSLVLANTSFAASEPPRTIVGYSSELSVRPGDTIDFKVNSVGGEKYDADLVRVINGESQSNCGDQFKVEYTNEFRSGSATAINYPVRVGSGTGHIAVIHQVEIPAPLFSAPGQEWTIVCYDDDKRLLTRSRRQ